MSDVINKISSSLQAGDVASVEELVDKALKDGVSAKDVLEQGLMPGMEVLADKFKKNEVYIPEVLMAAQAMNAGTMRLKPYLVESGIASLGKAIIGTVKGDLHDIGKNIVRMMLESKGFEVIDLGADVAPQKFLEVYSAEKPDIVAMSALLTTTMTEMKTTIDVFTEAGERKNVMFMVGGAPVSEEFGKSIGSDMYAPDAATAADKARDALSKKQ